VRAACRRLLATYLVLLLASHVVRRLPLAPKPVPADLASVAVARREAAAPVEGEVTLAHRHWQPEPARESLPVLLLLHGSPGSSRDFDRLGPRLGRELRVLAPDLPGFGASEKRLPDFSIRSHAAYALELLERLGIESAHLLGFSMGGGVALEMIHQAPERVRSLTLLSAIGVQELELLGSHRMNHAVHAVQLACVWLAREGTPHFGWLDDSFLGIPYARNFYDSDQRPLRGILRELEVPTLILHGERDILVPVAAAHEHHRLVPQSELRLFASDHFMVFRGGASLVGPIVDFIDRVERGEAARRGDADPMRRAAAAEPFDPRLVPRATGVTLLVLAALIAIATLVSEDLACIATGLLVAQGRIGFFAGTLACFVGIVVGDVLLYWAGRGLGRPWLARPPLSWLVSIRQVQRSSEWFERRGPVVVFLSRFLPGTRAATYFSAGLLSAGFGRFLLYFALAVAVWTPLLVGAASFLGSRLFHYFETFERWALPSVLLLVLGTLLSFRLLPLLLTWRGRRRLRGCWCRLRRWEFWPPWLFYPPVVSWVVWLAVKHRSLTLFTAANPAIPGGGFVGESKADILSGLASEWVAPFERIAAGSTLAARLAAVRTFLETRDLELPVVLKPDVGQRGNGVKIAHSWSEIERYCELARMDFLVQKYVAGLEFGVFWVRLPDRAHGDIISITEKRLPTVRGNGRATVEELVLSDPRAVCLAPMYLERLGSRRNQVPAEGEQILLAELGTHCRGAIFVDGGRLLTPALERTVEAISNSFEGFFFGRFDIRVPTIEAFQDGRDLTVVELNGVTSEATHIYDSRNSLLYAYGVLFRQWRLAFEVGLQNRGRGVDHESLGGLLGAALAYHRAQRAAQREELAE
jgi:pimeloyl-ACP methyl ester carboxylesterase/membrane protein DedA with SNARE-associated domain